MQRRHRSGGATTRVDLELLPKAPPNGHDPLPPPARTALWPFAIGTGVATLALGGVATGLLIAAGGKSEDARTLEAQHQATGDCVAPAVCNDIPEAFDAADGLYNASAGLFIAGGAMLVTTVILVAIEASANDGEASLHIVPVASPAFAGFHLTTSF